MDSSASQFSILFSMIVSATSDHIGYSQFVFNTHSAAWTIGTIYRSTVYHYAPCALLELPLIGLWATPTLLIALQSAAAAAEWVAPLPFAANVLCALRLARPRVGFCVFALTAQRCVGVHSKIPGHEWVPPLCLVNLLVVFMSA